VHNGSIVRKDGSKSNLAILSVSVPRTFCLHIFAIPPDENDHDEIENAYQAQPAIASGKIAAKIIGTVFLCILVVG